MPAPEADRAALEDEISFEADNAAMTQVDPHALWQPIVHPAAAHCNLPSSKVNMIVSFVARRFVASGVGLFMGVAGLFVLVRAWLWRGGSWRVRAWSWRACSGRVRAWSC